MFGSIVRFKGQAAVELLAAGSTGERRGATDIGVCGVNVMRQVVDMPEHETTHGTHGFALRRPRRVVRFGVPLQRRPRPERPRADGAPERRDHPGRRVCRPTVHVQRVLAVRLVPATIADEPQAVVDHGHVLPQSGQDEKRAVTGRALVRPDARVAPHMST